MILAAVKYMYVHMRLTPILVPSFIPRSSITAIANTFAVIEDLETRLMQSVCTTACSTFHAGQLCYQLHAKGATH